MVNKPNEIHLRYVNTVLSLTSCNFSMVLKLLPQTNISVLLAPFFDCDVQIVIRLNKLDNNPG